jgi:Laminin B (Domain IV)/VPDSG-CTERM motif
MPCDPAILGGTASFTHFPCRPSHQSFKYKIMSKQYIVRLAKFTGAVVILSVVAYPRHAAASSISTFDIGTEGWSAAGDVAGLVTWSATGGNPAGHVELTDQVIGGVTYFVAPAQFHGDHSAAYGTSLTFDLRQSYPGSPNQFDDSDVILTGGGLTLVFDTPVNPSNNSWTSYNVLLNDSSGWHVSTLSGALATQAQIQTTLANITDLSIRAEYQTGPDTDSLDNVFLFSRPSSIPDAGSTILLLGLAVSGLALLRRQLALS